MRYRDFLRISLVGVMLVEFRNGFDYWRAVSMLGKSSLSLEMRCSHTIYFLQS